MISAAESQTSSSVDGSVEELSPPPPALIDICLLHNSDEKDAYSIDQWLLERKVSTHFLSPLSIASGLVEADTLLRARAVAVIQGSARLTDHHHSLINEAVSHAKPIFVILIGSTDADDAKRLYRQATFLDLRSGDLNQLQPIVDHLHPAVPPMQSRFEKMVHDLIEGTEEERRTLLTRIQRDTSEERKKIAARLRNEINGPASRERERTSDLDMREPIATARSWMLSALVRCTADEATPPHTISEHFDPEQEPRSSIRYWILEAAYVSEARYLKKLVKTGKRDTAAEVSTLADLIAGGTATTERLRATLKSGDASAVWPILRALRVVPDVSFAPDICALLDRGRRNMKFDLNEALLVLCNARMAAAAAPLLELVPGLDLLVSLVLGASRKRRSLTQGSFNALFNAIGVARVVPLLRAYVKDPALGAAALLLLENLTPEAADAAAPGLRVAGYASDCVGTQTDQLGIAAEVKILTAIMMSREVTPPLAIGLFGDWGSGKSFFMRAMRESGERLALQSAAIPNSKFCANVVPIEFNAWHYADTNLWASLATFILDKLAEKIVVTPPDPATDRAVLEKELAAYGQKAAAVKEERVIATARLQAEGEALRKLRSQRESEEIELSELTARNVIEIINGSALKPQLATALAQLHLPAQVATVDEVDAAIHAALNIRSRAYLLFSHLVDPAERKTSWIALGVTALFGCLYLFNTFVLSKQNSVATVLAYIAQAGVVVGGFCRWIVKGVDFVNRQLATIEHARREVDKIRSEKRKTPTPEETKIAAGIEALKAKDKTVRAQLEDTAARVLEIEARLKEIREGRSLARFLSDRTKSDDYRKHLGLISTVRTDFEELVRRLGTTDMATADNQRPIERIVLYIDDLDRCPASKVVDVLQAVHLLLAYPLFVVVVGVDSRWLLNSLSCHYRELAGGSDNGSPVASPQNYLEKIFQIPYALEPMSGTGFGRLIGELMGDNAPREENTPREEKPTIAERSDSSELSAMADISGETAPSRNPGQPLSVPVAGPPPDLPIEQDELEGAELAPFPPSKPPADRPPLEVEEDALVLQPWEGSFAATLHAFIPSPRAAKRLSNIYRILKARVPAVRLQHFEGTAEAPGQFQVPLLLLAILIHDSCLASALFKDVLSSLGQASDAADAMIRTEAGQRADRSALMDRIKQVVSAAHFPTDKHLIAEWIPQVRRFSFDLARDMSITPRPAAA